MPGFYMGSFISLSVTMHISVLSVPPEAVNMSLGLSLAFATNPFRLLVSCLPLGHGSVLRGGVGT